MPLHSKLSWALVVAVVFALAVHLIGVWVAAGIAALGVGSFVRRVGWRRAVFPFTSHFSG